MEKLFLSVIPENFKTISRDDFKDDKYKFSRPEHKQGKDQTSGKGKVDYIFSNIKLQRNDKNRDAIRNSHNNCETGYWPTDHGMEIINSMSFQYTCVMA